MRPYLKYIFLAIALAAVLGIYLVNRSTPSVKKMSVDYEIDAKELFIAFEEYEEEANTRFLDKVLQVSGVVREAVQDDEGTVSITLDTGNDFFGVVCELSSSQALTKADFKAGQEVTVKGLCTGMSMDVVLVRCILILQ